MKDPFLFSANASHAQAVVRTLHHGIDIATLAQVPVTTLAMNDIGMVTLDLDRRLGALPFSQSTELGGFILIDRISHETVAFGFIADDLPEPAGRPGHPGTGVASPLAKLHRRLGPAGSPRRAGLAGLGLGHAAGSLLTGGVVYGLTDSLMMALPVAAADIALRSVLLGMGWASAQAFWRRRQSRNQAASENVLGDGI